MVSSVRCFLCADAPVSSAEALRHEVIMSRVMRLICNFDGVPTPAVTWFHNTTIQLNSSDPGINIITGGGASTLQISGVQEDDGGLYACRFNNVIGEHVSTTTVLILSECSRFRLKGGMGEGA